MGILRVRITFSRQLIVSVARDPEIFLSWQILVLHPADFRSHEGGYNIG
jgi:hypothetical protein